MTVTATMTAAAMTMTTKRKVDVAFFFPIHKMSFNTNKNAGEISELLSENLLEKGIFDLRIYRHTSSVFKGKRTKNSLIGMKPTENFLIAGNILWIYPSETEKGKVNVWLIGNIFVSLLFIIGIVQLSIVGNALLNYKKDGNLGFRDLISSQYFIKLVSYSILPLAVSYTMLYFNLVRKNYMYWKKTLNKTLLNNE
jgi:hypothetical protein